MTRPEDLDPEPPLNTAERLGVVVAVCLLLGGLLVLAGLWPW